MNSLRGKLIVSCQADPQDAFHGRMDLFARAAVLGGAAGIRANGPEDVRAIRNALSVPIIAIQKRTMPDGKVLITPSFEDAQALVNAGATAVALDCTKRGQSLSAFDRLIRIKNELHVPVLADIATLEEAAQAAAAGADFVLSTLRGYTDDTSSINRFDPSFIRNLVAAIQLPVIAEGRVNTPEAAFDAMRAGAFAVVVGSAITRPHQVTRAFADSVERAFAEATGSIEVLGIDMGGTNTKIGLVSSAGRLLWEDTTPTPAQTGRDGLLAHLTQVAQAGIARSPGASAIGLATAGWVDPFGGRVVYATENLPGWTGTEIAVHIAKASGLPVFVENDANALALGEAEFGAGRGLTDFVCITLGTGVGGGCYTGGRLNRGAHFFANALGHISIDAAGRECNCGQRGCLETYANVPALLGYAHGRYHTAEDLITAANAGEPIARNAILELAGYLARGCAILLQLLDPQALILGGGVVQNNPLLISDLKHLLSERVSVWKQRALSIVASPLGYHGGVLGAAALALRPRALRS